MISKRRSGYKLIVCDAQYGHIELLENEIIRDGKYKGLSQKQLFERIIREGYGNNLPAIFIAKCKDKKITKYVGKEAEHLHKDTNIKEIIVIAPIVGG